MTKIGSIFSKLMGYGEPGARTERGRAWWRRRIKRHVRGAQKRREYMKKHGPKYAPADDPDLLKAVEGMNEHE